LPPRVERRRKKGEKWGTESDFRPFFFGSAYGNGLFEPGGAQAARFVAVLGEEARGGRVFQALRSSKTRGPGLQLTGGMPIFPFVLIEGSPIQEFAPC
jgi:hypothetical protein